MATFRILPLKISVFLHVSDRKHAWQSSTWAAESLHVLSSSPPLPPPPLPPATLEVATNAKWQDVEVGSVRPVLVALLSARSAVCLGHSGRSGRRGEDRGSVQARAVHAEEQERRSAERPLWRLPGQRWVSVLLQVGAAKWMKPARRVMPRKASCTAMFTKFYSLKASSLLFVAVQQVLIRCDVTTVYPKIGRIFKYCSSILVLRDSCVAESHLLIHLVKLDS